MLAVNEGLFAMLRALVLERRSSLQWKHFMNAPKQSTLHRFWRYAAGQRRGGKLHLILAICTKQRPILATKQVKCTYDLQLALKASTTLYCVSMAQKVRRAQKPYPTPKLA
jgi:hypothetical protein